MSPTIANLSLRGTALALALAAVVPLAARADDDLLSPLSSSSAPRARSGEKAKPRPAAPAPDLDVVTPLVPVVPSGWVAVRLSGRPGTARVFVDGTEVGPADGAAREVSSGIHQLVVKAPGFADFEQSLTIRPKATTELSVTLQPSAGLLAVDADVPGAEVRVDGKLLGTAPVKGLVLAPGAHDVSVQTLSGQKDSARLMLRAGQESVFRAHLQAPLDRPTAVARLEPQSTRTNAVSSDALEVSRSSGGGVSPLLWVGVGVVAAAGVVTAVLLTQPRAHVLTADEVCQGQCDGTLNAPSLIHF